MTYAPKIVIASDSEAIQTKGLSGAALTRLAMTADGVRKTSSIY